MWIEFVFLDRDSWGYKPDEYGCMSLEQSKELEEEIYQHGRITGVRLQMGY